MAISAKTRGIMFSVRAARLTAGSGQHWGCESARPAAGRDAEREPRNIAIVIDLGLGHRFSAVAPAAVASVSSVLDECPNPCGCFLWCTEMSWQTMLTLLTALTVPARFSIRVLILIVRVPARPSRLKATSMPSMRRNVCARRRRPASAPGCFGQPALFFETSSPARLLTRRPTRLPMHPESAIFQGGHGGG
jgi:hypothetical protein